jgi:hypothetical protein
MPPKLKVYQTSLGFFDLAIAAPSMKAALRAWGASESNLFQQGFAKQSDDSDVIEAAMAQPGVVLRRPVGSNKRFKEHAELPTAESLSLHVRRQEVTRKQPDPPKAAKADAKTQRKAAVAFEKEAAKADEKAERKAAAAFQKEERRREVQRQKQEAAAARARARRSAAIDKARSALDEARRGHEKRAAVIEKDRAAVERRASEEETRWEKEKSRFEAALNKAGRQ